jgi:cyanate lyase
LASFSRVGLERNRQWATRLFARYYQDAIIGPPRVSGDHNMTREQCTQAVLQAKEKKNLSFKALADAIGRHEVWTAAALLGQATMSADEATKIASLLELGDDVSSALQTIPMKGSLEQSPPVDPLIYRFHEIVQVYGTTLKAVIHEKFGDGIMSAIDFTMDIQKVADPKGDRVKVTLDGKFLAYKKW